MLQGMAVRAVLGGRQALQLLLGDEHAQIAVCPAVLLQVVGRSYRPGAACRNGWETTGGDVIAKPASSPVVGCT